MTAITTDTEYTLPLVTKHFNLTLFDGQTWASHKLSSVAGCQITLDANLDIYVNYTLSSGTFTFNVSNDQGTGASVFVTVVGTV